MTQAAETMNIGLTTLQRWLRQFRGEVRGDTPTTTAITSEQRCHGNKQQQKVAVKLKAGYRVPTYRQCQNIECITNGICKYRWCAAIHSQAEYSVFSNTLLGGFHDIDRSI